MFDKPNLLFKRFMSQNFPNFKLLVLAAIGGIFIGAAVGGIRLSVRYIQGYLFGVDVEQLSYPLPSPLRVLLVTGIGGLLLGVLLGLVKYLNHLSVVDPVEANALKGGRMSFLDSLILVSFSVISITIGGSVGFEAAMTQLGAGTLSAIGQLLKLTRRELRILVSCGTGAGLAAIFGAPLAGAFYALELVIGGYGLRALMPTLLASTVSSFVIYLFMGYQPLFPATINDTPTFWHFPLSIFIGFCSALIGIAVMKGTTSFEQLLTKYQINLLYQPVIGGVLLGLLALRFPEVMGPGHTEINQIMAGQEWGLFTLALLMAKIIAAIVCVGSGFRGGLFSASLFLGAALGCVIHQLILTPIFSTSTPLDLLVVAGMAGVTVSIIGTPVAIILLMIETAGLHSGVITIVITVIVANQLTRYWFGYSFSTWRFHIRGNDIIGPQDIGRLRSITFASLPINKPNVVKNTTPIKEIIKLTKNANTPTIAVVNSQGEFLGLIPTYALFDENPKPVAIDDVIEKSTVKVFAHEPIVTYLEIAENGITKQFAVVNTSNKLIGVVSESTLLRRYLEEIIEANRDDVETLRLT